MKYFKRRLNNNKGFTLLEMIVVLFIVAVLMLLIVPNVGEKRERIDKQATEALANVIQTQVELFELENRNQTVSFQALLSGGYLSQKQVDEAIQKNITISGAGHVAYPK